MRLERDLASAAFELGVEAGLWRLVDLAWPTLTMAVNLTPGIELGLRILVDGYPGQAPAGQPWDLETNTLLPAPRWPITGRNPEVFRSDWSPANGCAPYLACDRIGLGNHPGWPAAHPARLWHPRRTIVFYLRELYRELKGGRLPPAEEADAA